MSLLKSKIAFHRSMATLLDAGVPIVRALRQKHPGAIGKVTHRLADAIEGGDSLHEGMLEHPRVFTGLETQLVAVGERTGRLDALFLALAEWFELRQRFNRTIISGLVYPALLYHVAATLIPGISFFLGNCVISDVIQRILLANTAPYLAILAFLIVRRILGPAIGAACAGAVLHVPVLGPTIRKLNYARFFRAYALSLDAGVSMAPAIELSASTCGNPNLRRRFAGIAHAMQSEGMTFTEAFAGAGLHHSDPMALSMLQTGEESGRTDAMATRIADLYAEEVAESAARFAKVAPTVVYMAIAMYIGHTVISFWSQLISQTTRLQ